MSDDPTTDIFSAPKPDPATTSTPNPTEIEIDALVGEGKKYASVNELAKAKLHADQFIDQLKSELSELRGDLNTRVRLEEVLDRLTSRQTNTDDNTDDDLDFSRQQYPSSQPEVNPDVISQLVDDRITKIERERTTNQNKKEAINALRNAFGDDYVERLKSRADELGMTREELNEIAGKSPSAFMAMMGAQRQESTSYSMPPNRMNTTSSSTQGLAAPGSAEFYKKLRAEKPDLYWTPKVQNQLHKDAIKAAQEGRPFDISRKK